MTYQTEHVDDVPVLRSSGAPTAPRTLEETGLGLYFLVELTVKTLLLAGPLRLAELASRLKLPVTLLQQLLTFMRSERLGEVVGRGDLEIEVLYGLTDLGRTRGEEMLRRNRYAGPAPASLEAYAAQVRRQSVRRLSIGPGLMRAAFDRVHLAEGLLDRLGPAMNSERPIFLFGPGGAGKSFIASRLALALPGTVHLPYAVAVDGEVVTVFDPLVHREATALGAGLVRAEGVDRRWVACHRPAVTAGGELTLDMLDLEFDSATRYYSAPPQVKANNGVLVVDDLGRQRVQPQELMNRWIVPLDRGVDYLTLHNARKFQVPFDVLVIFCTNLAPASLADASFLRRLGHKIPVGPLAEAEYRSVFRQECARHGIDFSDAALQHLLDRHRRAERPLLACYPGDLLRQIDDRARYLRSSAELTPETLDAAWNDYFTDAAANTP